MTSDVQVLKPGISQDYTRSSGRHVHTIPPGTRLMVEGGGTVTWGYGGEHSHDLYNHGHEINIPNHQHNVSIPSHTHSVDIPSHTHSVNIPNHQHSITLPNHTHDLEFGIYQGSIADNVQIKVDGEVIPSIQPGEDIDIIPHLSVDSAGKVQRNTWHVIEIIPNTMTRIVANIFLQIFTQSRGGGDY